ncbi:macro domain-containing protein [Lacticaseibacillus suihuaensis]
MLIYVKSNLFESPAQVLVNTVNTVGVMGKGIALQFKKLYPEMFRQYQRFCEQGLLTVGKLWIYRTETKWILNFPTKRSWRQKSRLEDIELGLQKFVATYEAQGIQSISFPQLGVGNGGLEWSRQVKPLMEKYLKRLPIDVYIHLYNAKQNPPEYDTIQEMRDWLDATPRMLSIQEFEAELVQRLIAPESEDLAVKIEPSALVQAREPGERFLTVGDEVHGYMLAKEDIAAFWTTLRERGRVLPTDYPQPVAQQNQQRSFEAMMTRLPYIQSQAIILDKIGGTRALTLDRRELPAQPVNQEAESGLTPVKVVS